ncbi:MAG: aminotransferase [Planctomycetaceae bacterium]|nr:aminotransferase [Planctomycetaceae bacterium]
MTTAQRIYLDNAATSWPKPDAVYAAVDNYMRKLGAPAGRGVYREAVEVERLVEQTRQYLTRLIGVDEPRRMIFTANGTDSLNLALHGLLRPGDHVVTSVCEHNSVLRPLKHLQQNLDVDVTRVGCDSCGIVSPDDIAHALTAQTKMIALTHASNVTGSLQPVAVVGQIAAEHGVLFLVDAAQTLGHLPIKVTETGAHLLAAPGHKGLLGPLGTGILYVGQEAEKALNATRQGGTGTASEDDTQPTTLPDKYESGNHNVPGIVGLNAAVQHILQRGPDSIREHEEQLTSRLLVGLAKIAGVTIHGPGDATLQAGVVSISIDGYDPQEAATILDDAYSVQVRSGLHCAPRMHESLGTLTTGGTIRLSVGIFNAPEHVDITVHAISELAASVV